MNFNEEAFEKVDRFWNGECEECFGGTNFEVYYNGEYICDKDFSEHSTQIWYSEGQTDCIFICTGCDQGYICE